MLDKRDQTIRRAWIKTKYK